MFRIARLWSASTKRGIGREMLVFAASVAEALIPFGVGAKPPNAVAVPSAGVFVPAVQLNHTAKLRLSDWSVLLPVTSQTAVTLPSGFTGIWAPSALPDVPLLHSSLASQLKSVLVAAVRVVDVSPCIKRAVA